VGAVLTPPDGALSYYDFDGDRAFDATEDLVWDLDASGAFSLHDLCLSGVPADGGLATAGPEDAESAGADPPKTPEEPTGEQSVGDPSELTGTDTQDTLSAGEEGSSGSVVNVPKPTKTGLGVAAAVAAAVLAFALRAGPAWSALAAIPMFSRLQRSRLLEHPIRSELYDLVASRPGIHYREILRTTGRSHGVIDYHLRRLVGGKMLRRLKQSGRAHYFTLERGSRDEHAAVASLQSCENRRLAEAVAELPAGSVTQVSRRVRRPVSTTHDRIRTLTRAGVLDVKRVGRASSVAITPMGRQALSHGGRVEPCT
jgi:predicted transcriptional regulator